METLETTANADALTARVAALLSANRPTAARHLMSAVRRLAPPSPRIAELAARVALAEGALDQALGELNTAVAQFPGDASLRKCRADTQLRKGDPQAALADAAEAVISTDQTRLRRPCSVFCCWKSADHRTPRRVSARRWPPNLPILPIIRALPRHRKPAAISMQR